MAILWDLAEVYGWTSTGCSRSPGSRRAAESSGRARQRMTVALRALEELSPEEQAATLAFMAELRARRDRG